jgi:hypothetical protein
MGADCAALAAAAQDTGVTIVAESRVLVVVPDVIPARWIGRSPGFAIEVSHGRDGDYIVIRGQTDVFAVCIGVAGPVQR